MIAIAQASEQLGGNWRLPTLKELQGLVCETCGPPKIKKNISQTYLRRHIGVGKKLSK